jgi:predicted phage terminase large subunit-like protein
MGESGLLNIMPRQIIEKHTVSDNELTLTNGSIIKGIPASEPDRFRGPQFHGGWLDELAAWDYLDEAWDMIQFGMRLGDRPILICTTTPKPKPLIIDLVNRDGEDVFVTRASTYDNLVNLAPTFKQQILQYEGTSIGRQELYAEIIDPEEGGIIKRDMFRLWKADKPLPQFQFVLQSYDCATSDKTVNDPTACVVLGVFKPSPDKPMSVMLVDCWSERMQYPDLRPRVIDEATSIYGDPDEFGNGKKVDQILIEDKSAGISLIQDLQRAGLNVRAYNPGRADKTARLNIVSPIIAKGLMYLPESGVNENQVRDWVEPFLNQVCAFPEVRNDDYVDALTQGLRLLRDMGFLTVDSIVDNSDMYVDETRPRRVNPYAV